MLHFYYGNMFLVFLSAHFADVLFWQLVFDFRFREAQERGEPEETGESQDWRYDAATPPHIKFSDSIYTPSASGHFFAHLR